MIPATDKELRFWLPVASLRANNVTPVTKIPKASATHTTIAGNPSSDFPGLSVREKVLAPGVRLEFDKHPSKTARGLTVSKHHRRE